MAKALPSLPRTREAVGAAVEVASTLFLGFGGFELDPPAIFLVFWSAVRLEENERGVFFFERKRNRKYFGIALKGVFGERETNQRLSNRRKYREGNGNSVLDVLAPL